MAKTHYDWPKIVAMICMGSKESWVRELDKRKVEIVLCLRKEPPSQPMTMRVGKCKCGTRDYIRNPNHDNNKGEREEDIVKDIPQVQLDLGESSPLSCDQDNMGKTGPMSRRQRCPNG